MPNLQSKLRQLQSINTRQANITKANNFPQNEEEFDKIIGYTPRPLQRKIDKEQKRFNSIVLHRRFGKTVMELRKILLRASFCPFPQGNYVYAASKYKDVKKIAWRYVKDYHDKLCNHLGLEGKKLRNESELLLRVPTIDGYESEIYLVGLDNTSEPVRGQYLDGGVLDEWSYYKQEIMGQIRPTLTDISRKGYDKLGYRNQWLDFIFTPYGRNHAYHSHKRAEQWHKGLSAIQKNPLTGKEEEVSRNDWYAVLYRASQTNYVDQEELIASLSDLGEDLYLQEFECSFDAAVKGSIYGDTLNRIKGRGQVRPELFDPSIAVSTAWDLGMNDFTTIIFFQQSKTDNLVRIIDYYEYNGKGLDHYVDIMKEKDYTYNYHLLPHDISVRELGTGKSRYDILRSLGMRNITIVPRVAKKGDSIQASNAMLERCLFDASSPAISVLLDHLSLYRREFNESLGQFSDSPVHDTASHAADALQNLAMGIKNFVQTKQEYGGGNYMNSLMDGDYLL